MKLPNLTQIIESVVIFIAAGSFIISYNNLHESALEMGIPPLMAIIFPLTIDAFLLVATLAVLYAGQHDGAKTLGYEGWLFLVLYTVASIAFNIHMAPDDNWSRAGFAMCPIGLCIALHFLMRILEIEMRGCPAAPPVVEGSPIASQSDDEDDTQNYIVVTEAQINDMDALSSIESVRLEPEPALTDNQRRVYEVFMNNPTISMAEAGRQTGLSYKTVIRHKNALKEMDMI